MSSLKSKIVIGLIRNRHLFKLKLKPEVVDENFSIEKFRKSTEKATSKMKLPQGVTSEKISINGINAEWLVPDRKKEDKVLMYIHGGGFISGSCVTHRIHVAKFAKECQLKSLVFDYSLAPEHPFPSAVDDCVEVYQWLLSEGFSSENIVIGGESAGATLSLSLLILLKNKGIDLPKAAFVISPLTDLSCKAASFTYNAENDIAPQGSWSIWTNYYVGETNLKDPVLSPQFADFTGIPTLYICVGTHEIHYDDCVNLSKVAKRDGVKVILREWKKMVHAFPILAPLFPEASQAHQEICQFVKDQLTNKTNEKES